MRPDLILEARAFVNGAFDDVEIALDLETGKILAVKRHIDGAPRRRHRGKVLVPSGVDLHVHLRDPGHPKKEDFRSGTRAAALGGVGTVVDMPNTEPLIDRHTRLEEKRDLVAGKACVDWGLWATLTQATPNAARLLAAATGVKLYLAPTTGIDQAPTPTQLAAQLRLAQRAGRLTAIHAEAAPTHVPRDLADHDRSRSAAQEVKAIEQAAAAAPDPSWVHIAHATTRAALDAAHAAGMTAGATPHHLLLSYDAHPRLGTLGRVNPPLRAEQDRAALWESLGSGALRIIETDHAPHTRDEKDRPFAEAPSGLPGVETAYPLLLRAARERHLDPARVIQAYSEAPAARFGLPKGRIAAGYDADFFLFDPQRVRKLAADDLSTICRWTPFEGWPAAVVETHYLHGEIVVEDSQFIGRAGHGRPLEPVDAAAGKRAWMDFLARDPPPPAPPPATARPAEPAGTA